MARDFSVSDTQYDHDNIILELFACPLRHTITTLDQGQWDRSLFSTGQLQYGRPLLKKLRPSFVISHLRREKEYGKAFTEYINLLFVNGPTHMYCLE